MEDKIIQIYEKKEEIKPLVDKLKKISFANLIKTKHFYYSALQKNTDLKFIEKKFVEFNRVELVQKREHRNRKISYDFYYRLDDETYIVYSIALENKLILINAFHVNRNFRHFRKKLSKAYKRQLTG